MDGHPLPPDDTVGSTLVAGLFPPFGLAVVVWAIRIRSRIRPKCRLTPADITITIALLAELVSLSLIAAAVSRGFGRHDRYIDEDTAADIRQWTYSSALTGTVASSLARISVACLLLQFAISRIWRFVIWAALAVQVLALVAFEITYLVQCRPVMAMWTTVEGSQCLKPREAWAYAYVTIGIAIVSDLLFAIMPMFIIWRLSRSVVERALVSFLLASGLFASAIDGIKIYLLATYDVKSPDALRDTVPEYLWCRMEEIVVIIAACAPLLKTPIERLLYKMGMPAFRHIQRDLNVIQSEPTGSGQEAWESSSHTDEESKHTNERSTTQSLRLEPESPHLSANTS